MKNKTSNKIRKETVCKIVRNYIVIQVETWLSWYHQERREVIHQKRLYDKNKEGLATLDDNTKKDKLQTAYQALEDDYYRILGDLKLNIKRGNDEEETDTVSKKQKV